MNPSLETFPTVGRPRDRKRVPLDQSTSRLPAAAKRDYAWVLRLNLPRSAGLVGEGTLRITPAFLRMVSKSSSRYRI
jgi:hypothetical protein